MKNKSFINRILSIVLIITIIIFTVGLTPATMAISVEGISVNGRTMSIEDYKELYGKPVKDRKTISELTTYCDIDLLIDTIAIQNDDISISYSIGEDVSTITGLLFNSQRNMNNIVAVFNQSSQDTYQVLYFEIMLGDEEINLLYDTSLNGKPHVKFYLSDNMSNIYLFEFGLPEQLENVEVINTDYCDIYNDYLWYVNIVDGYQPETLNVNALNTLDLEQNTDVILQNIAIAANKPYSSVASMFSDVSPNEMTSPTDPVIWGGKKIYTMTVTNGVDETNYSFYPYGYVRGSNVSNTGNSTWWCSFEVSEHTSSKMIGSPSNPTITYGINRFSARNVDISIVSGNYTMMVRSMIDGKVEKLSGGIVQTGGKLAAKVFKKVLSQSPVGKTALEIVDWLSSIPTSVTSEVTLGGSGISLNSTYTCATKLELDSKYFLDKYTDASGGGHKIVMQVDLTRTTDSTEMTTGAVRVEYDVYTNLYDKHDSHQMQRTFLYSNIDYDNGYHYSEF